MKKLFTTLLLFLIIVSAKSQDQFEGTWVSKSSTHATTVIASEFAVLKVFNVSFSQDSYIEETILYQTDNEFTTKLYNPRNGYSVVIKYKLKNDILICEFSGDFHGIVKLTKQKYNE